MSVDAQPVQHADAARATRRERTAWFVLAILLLFSIAAPLNQFKVPPIMPILMDAFKLSVGRAGLLMSVYAVTGLVLALPAGLIFQKLGYRITGLIAGGSIAVGASWGHSVTEWRHVGEPRHRGHRHQLYGGVSARDHRRMVRSSKAWSRDGHLVCLGPHRLDLDVDPRAPPEPGNELASGLVVRLSVRARGDGSLSGFHQASSKRFCGERPLIRTTSSCERGASFAQSRCLADQPGVWVL